MSAANNNISFVMLPNIFVEFLEDLDELLVSFIAIALATPGAKSRAADTADTDVEVDLLLMTLLS